MECYLGQIELFPYTQGAPKDWMLCNGASLVATQFQALFSLIGYQYGGSGTNFNLPNLQGLEPIPGMNYYMCVEGGLYPSQE